MPRRETIVTITMLAPSLLAFKHMQLTHRAFLLTAQQQFMVRCRWRLVQCFRRNVMGYLKHEYALPSGRVDGACVIVRHNGSIYTCGQRVNGRRHGKYQVWHACVRTHLWARRTYICGVMHGEYLLWHESGHLRERCFYVDNEQHGECFTWDQSGNPIDCRTYINGIFQPPARTFADADCDGVTATER